MKNTEPFLQLCRPGRVVMCKDAETGEEQMRRVRMIETDQRVIFQTLDTSGGGIPVPTGEESHLPLRCAALKHCEFRYVGMNVAEVVQNGKVCLTYVFH